MSPCRRLQRWAATALLALAAVGAQAELRFRIEELGYEGRHGPSEFFWPAAINNHGQVVGYLQQEVPRDDYTELLTTAYVSRGSRLLPLPGSGAFRQSSASGINDRGQVVGDYQPSDVPGNVPFIHADGSYRDLRVESKTGWDYTSGINASGQVAGRANAKAFFFDGRHSRYIDIPGAVASDVAGLNDRGEVLGNAVFERAGGGFERRAFVFDGQEAKFLPDPLQEGYQGFAPVGINNAGHIVGRAYRPDDQSVRSVIYGAGGRLTELGGLYGRADRTEVTALNDRDWAVGLVRDVDCNEFSCNEAFLWRDGRMAGLTGLLLPSQAQGWQLTHAADVNDRGQIVGTGWHHGFFTTFVLTPVPEPRGWALLLAGLGAVGLGTRRRPGSAGMGWKCMDRARPFSASGHAVCDAALAGVLERKP